MSNISSNIENINMDKYNPTLPPNTVPLTPPELPISYTCSGGFCADQTHPGRSDGDLYVEISDDSGACVWHDIWFTDFTYIHSY